MIEFCFETINWAPYFGTEKPDLPRLVRAASAAGFGWISFDESMLGAYKETGESLSSLRKLLDSEGLATLALHSAALGSDPQAAAQACQPLAEAAALLGAPYIHVGGVAPVGKALVETTNAAARVARDAGAAIAIEFLPFLDIASIEQCRALLRAADAEGSGIVVDTWHFFHGPDGWDELATLTANEIAYIQFDDSPALESDDLLFETTQRRVYPGDGIFDLARFAQVIEATGFNGVVGARTPFGGAPGTPGRRGRARPSRRRAALLGTLGNRARSVASYAGSTAPPNRGSWPKPFGSARTGSALVLRAGHGCGPYEREAHVDSAPEDPVMQNRSLIRSTAAVCLGLVAGFAPAATKAEIPAPEAHVHPGFAAYSDANDDARFVRLSEHVYAAVGYDIANIGFVVTDAGILVFDTGGEVERAELALAELRKVSQAPIVGVVYSHGHGDHTGGVDAFIPEAMRGKIPIYGGRNYPRYLRESAVPRGLMRALLPNGISDPEGQDRQRRLGHWSGRGQRARLLPASHRRNP